jgi:cytidine deaminase
MITSHEQITPESLQSLLTSLNQTAKARLLQILCSNDFDGVVPAETVQNVLDLQGDMSVKVLMVELLPVAQVYARPPVSNYRVGAVGRGKSGALFFGANLETPGEQLGFTLHAEQSVVLRALANNEQSLEQLAVSAPPCGQCRQFLNELASAKDLEIVVPNHRAMALAELLPEAFGPTDLGVDGALLAHAPHALEGDAGTDAVVRAALVAATRSYCPYTRSPAAVAIQLVGGSIVAAPYVENAAYNPSVTPMLGALDRLRFVERGRAVISRVVLVERAEAKIEHANATTTIMRAFNMEQELEIIRVD